MREEHTTSSEEATRALARSFAMRLNRGDVVALQGELGTGKTRFVKGVCDAFDASRHVSSPSFVILNRYEGRDRNHRPLYLYHLDLYRVKSVEEIYDLGFEEFAYGDNITLIENPSEEEKAKLYAAARLFVYPSFYEGFGFPPLEAMSYGVPVVTSSASSVPEICGNAALLVSPWKVEEITEGMHIMLEEDEVRKKYIAVGLERTRYFSWDKTATQVLNIFKSMAR